MSAQKRAEKIEAGNLRSYQELEQKMKEMGVRGFTMDTGDTRLAILIDHLLIWGLITEDQRWDFELAFHARVEDELGEVWKKVREVESERDKPRIATPPPSGGLLGPNGQPIKP